VDDATVTSPLMEVLALDASPLATSNSEERSGREARMSCLLVSRTGGQAVKRRAPSHFEFHDLLKRDG